MRSISRWGVLCVVAISVLVGAAPYARAQVPIEPPRLEGSDAVPYPEGATGDAVVVLEIVVDRSGVVTDAKVIEGAPPFDEHARRAVLGWRFVPAKRGDVAIPVRTRARVVFRAEEVVDETLPSPQSAAGSTRAPAPPAAAEEEVTVRGTRREIGQMTLSAADVREMPGAFGDAFRAIDALPGVTPMVSGLPYFFVRGAPPNNAGYFIDGVRVPLLFHVGLGPAVIHPELVERVDFHAGAAPAAFGRFAGPIISGVTREPSSSFRGAANLRIVDAGALLEAPFADGRGNALAAGRFGYPGPIISAFSDTTLQYWDYQSRASWKLGARDRVSAFVFGSHDRVGHVDPRSAKEEEDFASDFHRLDLRWDHDTNGGRARVAATLGYDEQGSQPTYLSTWSAALRAELDERLSDRVRARVGADARVDVYAFDQGVPVEPTQSLVPSGVSPAPTNVAWGARADVVWRVAPRVELVPGVRGDVYETSRRVVTGSRTWSRAPAVDPRLAARVTLTRDVAAVSSVGLAHQFPTLRVGDLPTPVVAGAGFGTTSSRLQTVMQTAHGVEIALPADVTVTATGFLSSWTGLTDLSAQCIQIEPPIIEPPPPLAPGEDPRGRRRPEPPYVCPNEGPVHGRAFGGELLVRRPLSKRLAGWLSYTLSRSTRESRFVRLDGSTATATVPSEFDRTHVLNAVLAYDFGRRWRAGSRFAFYTGTPYSRLSGSVPVPPYNALRDPPFYRLDVRIEKRWPFAKSGSIAVVLEGLNVTLNKEPSSLATDCVGRVGPEGGTNTCKRAEIGPITIPSIGVEAFF